MNLKYAQTNSTSCIIATIHLINVYVGQVTIKIDLTDFDINYNVRKKLIVVNKSLLKLV